MIEFLRLYFTDAFWFIFGSGIIYVFALLLLIFKDEITNNRSNKK